jgi:GNAT superfamily N-acetyltransferase
MASRYTQCHLSKTILEKVISLDKLASEEIKWWEVTPRKEFIELNKNGFIYSVHYKNMIVGFVRMSVPLTKGQNKTLKNEKMIELEDLYVLKEYRKKGIATKALKEVITNTRKQGFDKIILNLPKKLEHFYKAFGFKTNFVNMSLMLK